MKNVFTKGVIISAFIIAIVYIILVVYLMNLRFVEDTLFGNYPLHYKWTIMWALLEGLNTSMTKIALAILILTSLFTGINLTIVTVRLKSIKGNGKLHFMVGGSSIVGIVGSGCAMCGLPILVLLGLSGSLAYLPFQGQEISVVGLILLLIAFYSLVTSYSKELACNINPQTNEI